jgi:hypothetical protein
MTQRVTAEGIARQQNNIDGENERPDADAKLGCAGVRIHEPKGTPHIQSQHDQEKQRDIQKVPVNVLED